MPFEMKPTWILALLAASIPWSAAEPPEAKGPQIILRPSAARAPQAWLGLKVAKPDETITAHVPSLPPGIGFIVKSIDKDGPAQAAGLNEFDLLWKLDDQMLVNEAQLAALLRLRKPNDPVVIHGFRSGKPLVVKLVLGHSPLPERPFSGEMIDAAILPGACPSPMRMINVAAKTASFSNGDGTALVRRDGTTYHVKIDGPDGESLFEDELSGKDAHKAVPEKWQRRIQILCRTLDQALEGNIATQRQPRPRVVAPPAETP
jgi:hypothetical protein